LTEFLGLAAVLLSIVAVGIMLQRMRGPGDRRLQ